MIINKSCIMISMYMSALFAVLFHADARLLPETMDIDGYMVTRFIEQAMREHDDVLWHAQQSFVYQPEQAGVQLKAQMALSVWFSENHFNADAAKRFIFNSLRAACSIPSKPTLLPPNGTRNGPLAMLNEYALSYQMTLEEIDHWWLAVGSKTRRESWAHLNVEHWLRTRRDDSRILLALTLITRNADLINDKDIDSFEAWWRGARHHNRDHWVIMLIDRALENLNPAEGDPVRHYGGAKDQLHYLLPQAIYAKHGIGLPQDADEEQKRRYAVEPLDVGEYNALRKWWEQNREGYRIPTESPFREPNSQPWMN